MKRHVIHLMIALLFLLPMSSGVYAQFPTDIAIKVEETVCSTGDCEVVLRQYSGVILRYSIAVRCMDSAGNFSSWQYNSYNGIYPGTVCGG